MFCYFRIIWFILQNMLFFLLLFLLFIFLVLLILPIFLLIFFQFHLFFPNIFNKLLLSYKYLFIRKFYNLLFIKSIFNLLFFLNIFKYGCDLKKSQNIIKCHINIIHNIFNIWNFLFFIIIIWYFIQEFSDTIL